MNDIVAGVIDRIPTVRSINSDGPDVKTIPPLVYLAGILIGFLASIWMPIKLVPNFVGWAFGGILIFCGAVLTCSAVLKFKTVGMTVRPDRAASTLVISGPYKITRNQCISEWRPSTLELR
jgi:protein-S-isoprenylcysteine O-methyltransferase Ste14